MTEVKFGGAFREILAGVLKLLALFKRPDMETLFRKLAEAENLPTERLRARQRAVVLGCWLDRDITIAEGTYLLNQDDFARALSDRRLARHGVTFDAEKHTYMWSNRASARSDGSSWWARTTQGLFRSNPGQWGLTTLSALSLLIAAGAVVGLTGVGLEFGVKWLLHGTPSKSAMVGQGAGALYLAIITLTYGGFGLALTNSVICYQAGRRLIDRSDASRNGTDHRELMLRE